MFSWAVAFHSAHKSVFDIAEILSLWRKVSALDATEAIFLEADTKPVH